jgi:DNA polymerase-1
MLVVADAAQLEPRILAALAGDKGMVAAGAAGDLYAGIVESGAVETRDQAKVAMLGAMYGATTGESGRLMPRLAKAYPKAIGMVEDAARAGERGEVVTTRLGRSSPPGDGQAYDESASEAEVARVRNRARAWGRFTRNFIVQGTAAEWALCWMASTRRRLTELADGAWFTQSAHLVFFLHDEIVVHCPTDLADRVEAEVRAAAIEAGQLVFGAIPAEFPVTVAIVKNYGQAK